jgi:hypothetical protein
MVLEKAGASVVVALLLRGNVRKSLSDLVEWAVAHFFVL